jgi:hypothetical protein
VLQISRAEGLKKVKEVLAESAENLEGMEMAVRNAPQDKKTAMKARVGSCRELMDKVRVEVLLSEKENSDKQRLLEGESGKDYNSPDMRNASAEQYQQQELALTKKGDDHLEQALRDAREMEDVAIAIGDDLTIQREKIEGMKDRLVDINADIDQSESLMRQIYRRMMFNKIIFATGATAVVGAVSLVALKFFVL